MKYLAILLLAGCAGLPAAQQKALDKYKADQEECAKFGHIANKAYRANAANAVAKCMRGKGYK